jgi:predicted small metal-binding protein
MLTVTKKLQCDQIVPGCPWQASAETEEELLQQAVEHARHDHGIQQINAPLAQQVKAAIRDAD